MSSVISVCFQSSYFVNNSFGGFLVKFLYRSKIDLPQSVLSLFFEARGFIRIFPIIKKCINHSNSLANFNVAVTSYFEFISIYSVNLQIVKVMVHKKCLSKYYS